MSKKQEIVFTINMHVFVTCKKHTGNTFSKKIILISKNRIKGKSKCPICLTEIENKFDLKSKVKVYPKFFPD